MPFPYQNSFHPGPSSTAHYIPPIYYPLSQPAQPTFGTHNPFHYINSTQHDPTIAGKMYKPTTGRAETIGSLLAGDDATIWKTSLTNEIGCCTQGVSKQRLPADKIDSTQTIFFIKPNQVPVGRKVTYAKFVCTMRPNLAEVHGIRMKFGGSKLDAYLDVRSPDVGITDIKIHPNSTISDAHRGARYCTGNLKVFFSQF